MEVWMGKLSILQFGDLLGLFHGPKATGTSPQSWWWDCPCSWRALKWTFQIPREPEGDTSMFTAAQEGLGSLFRPHDCQLVSVQY